MKSNSCIKIYVGQIHRRLTGRFTKTSTICSANYKHLRLATSPHHRNHTLPIPLGRVLLFQSTKTKSFRTPHWIYTVLEKYVFLLSYPILYPLTFVISIFFLLAFSRFLRRILNFIIVLNDRFNCITFI